MTKYLIILFLLVSCGGGGETETKTLAQQDQERIANGSTAENCDEQRRRTIILYGYPDKTIEVSRSEITYYWIDYNNGVKTFTFGITFHGQDDEDCFSTDAEYVEVDIND